MINFKKNGRPTKVEKGLLKSINNFLSSLVDEEKGRYDFDGESVTDGGRLQEIWDVLNGKSSEEAVVEEIIGNPKEEVIKKVEEPEIFKEKKTEEFESFDNEDENNIEEIKEEVEEESNFVKNQKEMESEDEKILSDAAAGDVGEVKPPSFFNPMAKPVKQRSYNKAENLDVGEIDEPDFGKAPTAQEQIDKSEAEAASQQAEADEEAESVAPKKEKILDRITNDSVKDLPEKDRKESAKMLVETVLGGYEMMHELAKRAVVYSDEKLSEKIIAGEIDPEMEIDMGGGQSTSIGEFVSEFNESAVEALSYDPAFGEKVRPAMERVFAKRGWGVSDEQFLAIEFGKDIMFKTMQAITLKKTINQVVDTFASLKREEISQKEEEARMKYEYDNRQPPMSPDSITTPPPAAPPAQHEEMHENEVHEEVFEEEAENTETGTEMIPIET